MAVHRTPPKTRQKSAKIPDYLSPGKLFLLPPLTECIYPLFPHGTLALPPGDLLGLPLKDAIFTELSLRFLHPSRTSHNIKSNKMFSLFEFLAGC